jgi:APA family basic amino acid/polyamine antiporter
VEGGLNTSGEVIKPERTVPRAILLALSLTTFLYLGLQFTAQGILGPELAGAKAPLVATATALWGPWGGHFLVVATILSAAGYLTSDLLCSPRSMFALAEHGQLPRTLARVHRRFATPAVAIGTYSCLCFTAAVLGTFRQLAIIASSGVLLLYLICCLGLMRLRAQKVAMAGEPFRAPGGVFVPLAASAIIAWMLTTLEMKELIAAAAVVIMSGAAYGTCQIFRTKQEVITARRDDSSSRDSSASADC